MDEEEDGQTHSPHRRTSALKAEQVTVVGFGCAASALGCAPIHYTNTRCRPLFVLQGRLDHPYDTNRGRPAGLTRRESARYLVVNPRMGPLTFTKGGARMLDYGVSFFQDRRQEALATFNRQGRADHCTISIGSALTSPAISTSFNDVTAIISYTDALQTFPELCIVCLNFEEIQD